MAGKKHRVGVTVNGHVEKCTVPEGQLCSRHAIHQSRNMRAVLSAYRISKYTLLSVVALVPFLSVNPFTLVASLAGVIVIASDMTAGFLNYRKNFKYKLGTKIIASNYKNNYIDKETALLKLESLHKSDIQRGKIIRKAKMISIIGSSLAGLASMPLIVASSPIAVAIYSFGVVISNSISVVFYSIQARATDKFLDVSNTTKPSEIINNQASKEIHQKIVKNIQKLAKTSKRTSNVIAESAENLALSIFNDDFDFESQSNSIDEMLNDVSKNKTIDYAKEIMTTTVETYEELYYPNKKTRNFKLK